MKQSFRSDPLIWALVVAAAATLVWRPFVLGFYMDDWFHLIVPDLTSAPFSLERWAQTEVSQNRPVFRFIAVFLHSLIPLNAAAWHVWLVVLSLITAASMALAINALLSLRFERPVALKAALIGVVFWLAFPFAVPNAFWPTASTALFSVVFLCVSVWLMANYWSSHRFWPFVTVFLVSTAGYLTYEAIYLQLIVILAFLAIHFGWRSRQTAYWCLAIVPPQLGALIFNRVMRAIGAEGTRAFNTNFLETYFWWFDLPARYLGTPLLSWPMIAAIWFAIVFFGVILAYRHCFRRESTSKPLINLSIAAAVAALATCAAAALLTFPISFLETAAFVLPLTAFVIVAVLRSAEKLDADVRWFALMVTGLSLSLICLTALAFAAGNFVMWAHGTGGRVTVIANVWIAFLISIGASIVMVAPVRSSAVKWAAVAVWCGFAVATLYRGAEWHQSWMIQQAAFESVPEINIAVMDEQSAYVYSGPENPGWVPAFETDWQMGAFATAAFLDQARDDHDLALVTSWTHRWMVSRKNKFRITWDGEELVRRHCDEPDSEPRLILAEKVWIWDGWNRVFEQAPVGSTWGCDTESGS